MICRFFRSWKRQLTIRRAIFFVAVFFLLLLLFLKRFLAPKLPVERPDLHLLRRKGWKSVYHATTYFVTGNHLEVFDFTNCPERRCVLTGDSRQADAVVFHMTDIFLQWWTHAPRKNRNQVWVLYGRESPVTTLWHPSPSLDGYFNWTMTHQRTSDIVVGYYIGCRWKRKTEATIKRRNYLQGRKRDAFIVMSNCHTASDRLEYVRKMQKHMQVDVFGNCGTPCSSREDKCDFEKMATEYKFYLSFENSLCKDYISEKFFRNALRNNIVPVVRGGMSREDYKSFVPDQMAFISADDFAGGAALAKYLTIVGRSEKLYRRHMAWRDAFERDCPSRTTNWIQCRLCQALHNRTMTRTPRLVRRMGDFWNRHRDCRDRVVRPERSSVTQLRDYLAYLFQYN